MTHLAKHLVEIVHLTIRAVPAIRSENSYGHRRKILLQAPRHVERRIIGVGRAKKQFILGIVETAKRREAVVEPRIITAQRFENGKCGRSCGPRRRGLAAKIFRRPNHNQVVDDRRREQRRKQEHVYAARSSKTPAATSSVPAQRATPTRSRKMKRAPNVCATTVAAVAGTEKLKSSCDTRIRKLKKATVIPPTPSISQGFENARPNDRSQAPGRKSSISPVCFIPRVIATSPIAVDPTTSATKSQVMTRRLPRRPHGRAARPSRQPPKSLRMAWS